VGAEGNRLALLNWRGRVSPCNTNNILWYNWSMRTAIQARLDDRSRKRLAVLVRELGWTPSRVVREGLRVLEASYLRKKRRGVIGLGKFRSGVPDLGSNKKHLREFGR